jgi:hypothetical protein
MPMIKREVEELIERLPSDSTIEDIQYHLYVMDKVNKGLDSIDKERGLTQEQTETRLAKWLT